ncbi:MULTISPECIES: AAA family ATPase [Halomonadaceae]|uniref:AAA family ATPase n=1 Tax=Halomonadaceae TaxID=28256 RepID=UPI001598DE0D|nr:MULTISPECIES: AAA family ATPase [Halomonas]QJQ96211.1 AAA family ATPase [Halomonas sp. PA5]
MKILALRLQNLASLPGPLELDFSAPPLRDVGLFAITGPTGAGKSTLLDALCLALYGNTPRLRQAPGRDAPLPDVEGETVSTADPRTLLRRGTAQGHAEVDFLGRDGRRYRARWAVRRAREKASGRLQAVEQSLSDLEDQRLLTTQKREFDRLLPERLGLNFEQFTRAVLLAQSEFAAFLKADDNERSDLLERLTGTHEYSRISIAAYRRASEARKCVDALETKLADGLPAEPESRAGLEREAEATQQALTYLKTREESLKTQQRWHGDDARLQAAHAEGCRQLNEAETRWHALASLRTDREYRNLIAPQRHRLTRQTELPGEIVALETIHANTRQALEAANAKQKSVEKHREQADRCLADAQQARQRAEPALRQARTHDQALATYEKQLAELIKTQEERHQQANRVEHERHQARQTQQALEQRRDTQQAALHQLMGDHHQLGDARQALQHALDQAARRSLALNELSACWREACRAEQAHRHVTQRLQDDKAHLAQLKTQGKTARRHHDEQERRYRTLSAFIERNRAARSESVLELRQLLHEGGPCPVCGGHDHPWRHQPPPSHEAAQLVAQQAEEERQLEQTKQARDQAQQTLNALLGEYRAVTTTLAQCQQERQEVERRLAEARNTLATHALHAELAAIDTAEYDAWLTQQRQASDAERRQAEQALQTLTRAENELAPLQESQRQSELTLAQLDTQRSGLEQERARLAAQLPPLRQAHDEAKYQLASLLGEHPSADAWQQHLDTRQEAARQARDSAIEQCHAAERDQARLAQQAIHEAQRIESLTQERDTLTRELAEWRRAHPQLDDAGLARLLAQSDEDARQQERELNDADEARQRSEASLAERRQALLQHRRDQGLADEPNADNAALLGEAVEHEIERRRQGMMDQRDALAPQLEATQQARDEAAHALRDDDRRRARQQHGQAELEAARAEYVRWGRISELIGSADGKAFRRIAQVYNLEQLLEHANLHLAGLSRRYRLARGGTPLGLLVVDHDMGDERRSVHSLSGGETFLVSLALALGLASMASGELVIESLFIDEGFGSLDPQSLALAMEALDGLQALGRRVGVISHVQEMHERIPVQIQVEPLGNGTSRARITSQ